MSRWNASTSTLILLGSAVFVVLLLVVLPDVDPPDTAFHGRTAPAVVHAQANRTPTVSVIGAALPTGNPAQIGWTSLRLSISALQFPPNSRSIQLRSIRC